ncbi:recombinase family protein [Lacisediminihabitans sp.]|jgi:DNA invertase Pin-like site-specific DNA recombinase|uniref:recombinase family protein n=1 Tax=Lacisediminihabitans sp. TaxID=2787631 RepID=UPI002F935750
MVSFSRVAVYARISRDVTGEGLGVERQLEDCRRIANERGWVVAEEYVDNDISAFGGKHRPAYQRMLEDITAGIRDAVIVYNADRLTRRPIELEQFTQVCEAAKVTQLVAVTGDINFGNDDGMFMARVLAAVAAKESGRKSERLKRKAIENAEAGKPNGGRRPFGYEKDQLAVREAEATIIREVAARYLAGESLASLTLWLQDQQVATVTGAKWSTSAIRQVLTNPRIAGLRAHNGTIVGAAQWPGIISPAEHQQLIAMFARKTATGRRVPRRYLLSGLLRCGKCGGKLFSSVRVDTRRYVCMSGPDHGGCGSMTIVAGPVEEWVTQAVLYRLNSTAMVDVLAGRAATDDRYAVLSAELQGDQAQLVELSELWAAKGISTAEWKAARETIEARIDRVDRQLAHLTGDDTLTGLIGTGNELETRWGTLNLSRQAAIIGAVLDYATVNSATRRGREFDPTRIVPQWRV